MNSTEIGYYSSLIGLGFAIAFLGCIDYLSKHFAPLKIVYVMFLITIFCVSVAIFWHSVWAVWLITVPIGFASATMYVLLSTIGSNKVAKTHQGWFMGATMSVLALAWFLMPLINSLLFNWHLTMPLIVSGVFSVAALWLYHQWCKKEENIV